MFETVRCRPTLKMPPIAIYNMGVVGSMPPDAHHHHHHHHVSSSRWSLTSMRLQTLLPWAFLTFSAYNVNSNSAHLHTFFVHPVLGNPRHLFPSIWPSTNILCLLSLLIKCPNYTAFLFFFTPKSTLWPHPQSHIFYGKRRGRRFNFCYKNTNQ